MQISMSRMERLPDSEKVRLNEESCIRRAEGRNGLPQAVVCLPDTISLN
jgi:hypothetical protein